MSLISFSNVSKSFGTDLLLDHISFNINLGEKVALVGPNGIGKSTIFKLILKEELPTLMPREDKVGAISILGGTNIGYLSQQAISDINNTVYEELKSVFKETLNELDILNEMSNNLSTPEDIEKYNDFLEYLNEKQAFSIESKIKGYISKFHFEKEILDKKISTLSGGERIKIAFVKLLLEKHDVLLLDEPTNHLDISTIEWLEEYLKNFKGIVLFISHDRYFLNTVADKILDLDNKKVTTYNLSYDDYLKNPTITDYKDTIVYGTRNCECGNLANDEVKFQFTDYLSEMQDAISCTCGKTTVVEKYAPIMEFVGYSAKIDGNKICVGYTINDKSLKVFTEKTGKTLSFGVTAAIVADGTTQYQTVNSDLTAVNDKTIVAQISAEYAGFDFILSGFTSAHYEKSLVMCAFAYDGTKVIYIDLGGCNEYATPFTFASQAK